MLQYGAFEDNVQSRQDREVHGAKTVCGPDRGLLYCLLLCVDCLFQKAKSIVLKYNEAKDTRWDVLDVIGT